MNKARVHFFFGRHTESPSSARFGDICTRPPDRDFFRKRMSHVIHEAMSKKRKVIAIHEMLLVPDIMDYAGIRRDIENSLRRISEENKKAVKSLLAFEKRLDSGSAPRDWIVELDGTGILDSINRANARNPSSIVNLYEPILHDDGICMELVSAELQAHLALHAAIRNGPMGSDLGDAIRKEKRLLLLTMRMSQMRDTAIRELVHSLLERFPDTEVLVPRGKCHRWMTLLFDDNRYSTTLNISRGQEYITGIGMRLYRSYLEGDSVDDELERGASASVMWKLAQGQPMH